MGFLGEFVAVAPGRLHDRGWEHVDADTTSGYLVVRRAFLVGLEPMMEKMLEESTAPMLG